MTVDTHPLERALAEAWPPEAWHDVTVLLAVSGGADSVAMLRAVAALKTGGPGRLCVAHLNHKLRGQESDDDQAFVTELCGRLGTHLETGQVDTSGLVGNSRDGLEAAARKARYDFLRQTADRLGARYVVTAHTADDQAETILHRILRGTGVAGLAGMARARPLGPGVALVRPLLAIHRREIIGYLEKLGQPYRQDSSNVDVKFTRNRIRHQLLPSLAQDYNPSVVDALLRLGAMAAEVQSIVDALVADLADRCVSLKASGEILIDVPKLGTQPRHILRELLKAAWREQGWPLQSMGFAEWDLLADMLSVDVRQPRSVARKQTWFKKGSGTVVRSTLRAVPATVPDPFLNHARKQTFPGSIRAELTGEQLRLRQSPRQPTGTTPP